MLRESIEKLNTIKTVFSFYLLIPVCEVLSPMVTNVDFSVSENVDSSGRSVLLTAVPKAIVTVASVVVSVSGKKQQNLKPVLQR